MRLAVPVYQPQGSDPGTGRDLQVLLSVQYRFILLPRVQQPDIAEPSKILAITKHHTLQCNHRCCLAFKRGICADLCCLVAKG